MECRDGRGNRGEEPMTTQQEMTLKEEQEAFEGQLDEMLFSHADTHVLFKGGQPIEFFNKSTDAYEAGLDRFGLDTVFLVAPVIRTYPRFVSLAWDTGVMFGKP